MASTIEIDPLNVDESLNTHVARKNLISCKIEELKRELDILNIIIELENKIMSNEKLERTKTVRPSFSGAKSQITSGHSIITVAGTKSLPLPFSSSSSSSRARSAPLTSADCPPPVEKKSCTKH